MSGEPAESLLKSCQTYLIALGWSEALTMAIVSDKEQGGKLVIEVMAHDGSGKYVGANGDSIAETLEMVLGILRNTARERYLVLAVLFGELQPAPPIKPVLRVVPRKPD